MGSESWVPKIGGSFLGVHRTGTLVFWAYIGVPLFWENAIYNPLSYILQSPRGPVHG